MADIAAEISRPFRITDGRKFTLDDWDPGDRAGLKDKGKAQDVLQLGVNRLAGCRTSCMPRITTRCC